MIMETNELLAIVIFILSSIVLFWIGNRLSNKKEPSIYTFCLVAIYGILVLLYAFIIMWNDYRDGQIDALKGKYKYRMEINYDQHGTPKDTIYVKEEWRKNMEKDTVVIVPIRPVIDTVIYINR